MKKRKINLCQNHLPEFFKAIKAGDVSRVEALEHQLTPEEECVACAFVFKTKGTVRDALESFLNKEGFEVEKKEKRTIKEKTYYWLLKGFILLGSLLFILFFLALFKGVLFGSKINLLALNIMEMIFVSILTIFVFVVVDDKLLE